VSAAPEVYAGPAFVGWRSWRILPFERLGEATSVRLCASGTQGIPKVWEPGRATVAVCGKFRTTHEAPWPGCECGVYGYRTREAAEDHLEQFREGNGEYVLGWAFGRVSLWGRIVECEHGWRAQQAYPYAIDVYAEPPVAAALRRLYGVDVEQRPPFEPLPEVEEEDEVSDVLSELDDLADQIAKLKAAATTIRPTVVVKYKPRPDPPAEALVPLPAVDLSDDDVLVAVFAAIHGELATCSWHRRVIGPMAERSDAALAVHVLYGDEAHTAPIEADGWPFYRPYNPVSVKRVNAALKSLQDDGLLDSGRLPGRSNLRWRMTPEGQRCIRELQAQGRVPKTITWRSHGHTASEVPLPAKGGFRARVRLFDWEIARDTPGWRAERQAIQQGPRVEYNAWLTKTRRESLRLELSSWTRFAFTDDEVLDAVRVLSIEEPASGAALRTHLLPGATRRTIGSETAGLSQTLVRLRSAGLVKRSGKQGALRWSANAG
jgi:hypothetical protein